MSEISRISLAEFSRLYLIQRNLADASSLSEKPHILPDSGNNLAAHIVLGMSKAAGSTSKTLADLKDSQP